MSYLPHDDLIVSPTADLAAILNSIPSGTRVYLPAGTFVLSAGVTFTSLSNVLIEGGPGTVIQYAGAGQAFYIESCSSMTFRGFRIETTSVSPFLIHGANTRLAFIDLDLTIGGVATYGMYVYGGSVTDFKVIGCNFNGAFSNCIIFSGSESTYGVRIVDTTFVSSGNGTLLNFGGGTNQDTVVANCFFQGGTSGISTTVDRMAVDGCTFYNHSNGNGIDLNNASEDVAVTGCIFDTVKNRGISLNSTSVKNVTIDGNIVKGNVSAVSIYIQGNSVTVKSNIVNSPPGGQGIYGASGSSDMTIRGNVIYNVSNYDGIYFAATTPTRILISGNVVHSVKFKGIFITGAHNTFIITHNICHSNTNDVMIRVVGAGSNDQVTGNIVAAVASSHGIEVNAVTASVVAGNVVDTTQGHGILIANVSNQVGCHSNIVKTPGSAGGGSSCGIYYNNSGSANCRGNVVYDITNTGQHAIQVDGANGQDLLFESCVLSPVRARAIYLAGSGSGFISIRGCIVVGPSTAAQSLVTGNSAASGTDSSIDGCMIISSSNFGISAISPRMNVTSCHVVSCGNSGIRFATANPPNCNIAFNMVTGCTNHGVIIEGNIARFNIKGNSCIGNTQQGILINTSDEGNVCGNRCYNNGGYGIQEDAGSDQNLYSENHLRNNTTGASNMNGTNRTFADNKV